MLTLNNGIKIDPEAHVFAVKRVNIRIERSEILASKEAKTAPLEERTSENAFFEVEKGSMYGAGIVD
ncbi:hypothetical protein TNCV_2197131 [Trichonephila clavipes]|nr:hypothetical protein TNCV_2197131 [Trichonephila clavipes]